MSTPDESRLPAELAEVAGRLRSERPEADSAVLGDVRSRLITRTGPGATNMKARLATLLTLATVLVGSGGALAVADSGSSGTGASNAASSQYLPGKHCGDKNHTGTGDQGQQKPCPDH